MRGTQPIRRFKPPCRPLRPHLATLERRRREYVEGRSFVVASNPATRVGASAVLMTAAGAAFCSALALAIPVASIGATAMTSGAGRVFHAALTLSATPASRSRGDRLSLVPPQPRPSLPTRRPSRPLRVLAGPTTRPTPTAAATPAPVPTVDEHRFHLVATSWRLTADGLWSTDVIARLGDAGSGVRGGDLDVQLSSSDGTTVGLEHELYGAPAIRVTLSEPRAIAVSAEARTPALGQVTLAVTAPEVPSDAPMVSVTPIGAHVVAIGWSAVSGRPPSAFQIFRRALGGGRGELVATMSPNARTVIDTSARAGASYVYDVIAESGGRSARGTSQPVTIAAEPAGDVSALDGKGMFLFYSVDPSDVHVYGQYDPDAVVAQARSAGVRFIELRLSRGTFFEAQGPEARAWLDRLIDAAAAADLRLVAWTVPRRPTAEDLARSAEAAAYRTPAGNGFSALALDLEPGDRYMGDRGPAAERMVDYVRMLRSALGRDYPIVAIVMSPHLTRWTNGEYPYRRIAAYVDAMQPMEYWHHYRISHAYEESAVADACGVSVTQTRRLAGRDLPIAVAGQTADLGTTGSPSGDELRWCLGGAKAAGAVGDTFFDWHGTNASQWSAIGAFAW